MERNAEIAIGYRQQADEAKEKRMDMNTDNWNCYHLRMDWSHKKKGQSMEFLSKQATATEQLTSFMSLGLVDQREWYKVEPSPGIGEDQLKIKTSSMKKLLAKELERNDVDTYMADALKMGFLGSLMIGKVTGEMEEKVVGIKAVEDEESGAVPELIKKDFWRSKLSLVRAEDFYPDPTGAGLYLIEDIEIDYHELVTKAEKHPKVYDMKAIKDMSKSLKYDQDAKKSEETNQNTINRAARLRVTIHEFWGDLVDPVTGEVIMRNATMTFTPEGSIIAKLRKNPNWHQKRPYVVAPIVRVPKSVWHRALMDTATKLNVAMNELFNLQLDAGIMSTYGIKQAREDWLEDPTQIENGIAPGETLLVNELCPPGSKVVERVDTSNPSPEASNIFNLTDREFNMSALTNDIRMGAQSQRQVKATEIVSSNQSLNTIYKSVTKNIETKFVEPILELLWLTMAQNMRNYFDKDLIAAVGREQAAIISGMSNAEIYAETGIGKKYKVFGLSTTLNKINDFRKITSLLQTISSSDALISAFQQKYSLNKLLDEIMKSLDIDTDKIQGEQQELQNEQQGEMDRRASIQGAEGDMQSQIAQAGATREEEAVEIPRGQLSQDNTSVRA